MELQRIGFVLGATAPFRTMYKNLTAKKWAGFRYPNEICDTFDPNGAINWLYYYHNHGVATNWFRFVHTRAFVSHFFGVSGHCPRS